LADGHLGAGQLEGRHRYGVAGALVVVAHLKLGAHLKGATGDRDPLDANGGAAIRGIGRHVTAVGFGIGRGICAATDEGVRSRTQRGVGKI
jgi:hypothetical protein